MQRILVLLTGVTLLSCTMLIAIESFLSFVVLGSYSVAFHGFAARSSTDGRRLISEVSMFVGQIMVASVAVTGVFYYVSVEFDGFESMLGHPNGLVEILVRVANCFYGMVVTFLGVGDPGAINGPAKLAEGFTAVLGPAYLVLIFALVIGGNSDSVGATSDRDASHLQPVVVKEPVVVKPAISHYPRRVVGKRSEAALTVGVVVAVALAARAVARTRPRPTQT